MSRRSRFSEGRLDSVGLHNLLRERVRVFCTNGSLLAASTSFCTLMVCTIPIGLSTDRRPYTYTYIQLLPLPRCQLFYIGRDKVARGRLGEVEVESRCGPERPPWLIPHISGTSRVLLHSGATRRLDAQQSRTASSRSISRSRIEAGASVPETSVGNICIRART